MNLFLAIVFGVALGVFGSALYLNTLPRTPPCTVLLDGTYDIYGGG